MKRLPQKTSLVTETARIILEEIKSGQWMGWLPGEHELCEQLHVSRTTVRAALDQLSRQGILRCRQGRRREIVSRRFSQGKVESNRVVLLVPDPFQTLLVRTFLIDRLREHLVAEGFFLETHVSRVPFREQRPQELEKLATMLHPVGWVLMSSTEPLQRWFAGRHLPCVIAGSRYDGIELPSVDVDYGAVCRHAVGQFLSRGHRRIVLLNPQPTSAGDALTETGFQKMVQEIRSGAIEASIVNHNGDIESICSRLDSLMARRQPPTAFLVSRARHALTVLCHLLRKGVNVPRDVAVISRDEEGYLEDVVPTMARYSSNPNRFAAKLSRTVIEMVHGTNRVTDHKVMSQFIPGQTLG